MLSFLGRINSDIRGRQLALIYEARNESSENLKKVLKTDELQEKINAFLDKNFTPDRENINDCVNEFQNIINLASKRSLKIKKKKFRRKISNVANKKWFDKIVDLKDTTSENLQTRNIGIQIILKSEICIMQL